ncbi:MAG: hypothetical protein P1U53_18010 [Sulfitobacter sp.]|nr:hypothetical protein [Sulfitobacter sp.]
MKRVGALLAVLALAGCGTPDPNDRPAGRSDTRQQPSNYEPGIHVSGHVNVGVVRSF